MKIGQVLRYTAKVDKAKMEPSIDGLPNWYFETRGPDGSGWSVVRIESGINTSSVDSKGEPRLPFLAIRSSPHRFGSNSTPWERPRLERIKSGYRAPLVPITLIDTRSGCSPKLIIHFPNRFCNLLSKSSTDVIVFGTPPSIGESCTSAQSPKTQSTPLGSESSFYFDGYAPPRGINLKTNTSRILPCISGAFFASKNGFSNATYPT